MPLFLRTFFLKDIVFESYPFRSFISKCPFDDFFLKQLLLPLLHRILHSTMQWLLRFPPFPTVLTIPILFFFVVLQLYLTLLKCIHSLINQFWPILLFSIKPLSFYIIFRLPIIRIHLTSFRKWAYHLQFSCNVFKVQWFLIFFSSFQLLLSVILLLLFLEQLQEVPSLFFCLPLPIQLLILSQLHCDLWALDSFLYLIWISTSLPLCQLQFLLPIIY